MSIEAPVSTGAARPPVVEPTATIRSDGGLLDYVRIARPDHWIKNVFALPGIAAALALTGASFGTELILRTILGLTALCLVASSNYVINEILDAPMDRHHPNKADRPIASGRVKLPVAYAEWLVLMVGGVGLGALVSLPFASAMVALWVMGCVYNIPPIRSKDAPYLDVLSESVNNPLRMLAGWYIVSPVILPPASLLLSYWLVGAYFMAIKRFAEYRSIADPDRARRYRKSFGHYTESRLLVSIAFYSAGAMLFFGAFLMRYRIELVFAFPFVAWVMATYMSIGLKADSAAQAPERLYREGPLLVAVIACLVALTVALALDIPAMHQVFAPTVPIQAVPVAP
jgi:decaprenyl-phosphate phosphoribosyltransferase